MSWFPLSRGCNEIQWWTRPPRPCVGLTTPSLLGAGSARQPVSYAARSRRWRRYDPGPARRSARRSRSDGRGGPPSPRWSDSFQTAGPWSYGRALSSARRQDAEPRWRSPDCRMGLRPPDGGVWRPERLIVHGPAQCGDTAHRSTAAEEQMSGTTTPRATGATDPSEAAAVSSIEFGAGAWSYFGDPRAISHGGGHVHGMDIHHRQRVGRPLHGRWDAHQARVLLPDPGSPSSSTLRPAARGSDKRRSSSGRSRYRSARRAGADRKRIAEKYLILTCVFAPGGARPRAPAPVCEPRSEWRPMKARGAARADVWLAWRADRPRRRQVSWAVFGPYGPDPPAINWTPESSLLSDFRSLVGLENPLGGLS
jgi:hypothetical protein